MAIGSTKSINQIVDLFRSISDRHLILQDFGNGPSYHIDGHTLDYPYLWTIIEDSTTVIKSDNGFKEIEFAITLRVADLINNVIDDTNLGEESFNGLDTTSDTQQIILDIIAEFSQDPYYRNNRVSIAGDVSITPFFDEMDGKENGWEASLEIRMPYTFTYCELPYDGSNTQGPTSPGYTPPTVVNIYNVDGTLVSNRILNGGGYNLSFNNIDEFSVSSSTFSITGNTDIMGDLNISDGRAVVYQTSGTISTSTYNLDWSLSNNFDYVLETSCTMSISNGIDGQTVVMAVTQDGLTGSNTLSITGVKWNEGTEPTLTTATSSTDVYTFVQINGSIYGSSIQNMF